MWLTLINLRHLVEILYRIQPQGIYLVQPPRNPSVSQLRPLTQASRLTPTRRSLIRSPGVWVPPIVSLTPEGEPLFDYTPSASRELLLEIMGTLVRSAKSK